MVKSGLRAIKMIKEQIQWQCEAGLVSVYVL